MEGFKAYNLILQQILSRSMIYLQIASSSNFISILS